MSNWFSHHTESQAKSDFMILGGLALMALGTFLPATAGTVWDKLLSLFEFGSLYCLWYLLAVEVWTVHELFQKHIFDVFHNPHKLKNLVSIEERWAFTEALRMMCYRHKGLARATIKEQFFDNELEYHMEDLSMKYSIIVDNRQIAFRRIGLFKKS